MTNAKRIADLEVKLARQEAHVARMTAFDPTQRSIRAAVKIAEMYRERLAELHTKKEAR
jgi:hypothetical protein